MSAAEQPILAVHVRDGEAFDDLAESICKV